MTESLVTLVALMADELDAAGYAIVPKKPTAAMLYEARDYTLSIRETYQNMINAAPKVAS